MLGLEFWGLGFRVWGVGFRLWALVFCASEGYLLLFFAVCFHGAGGKCGLRPQLEFWGFRL